MNEKKACGEDDVLDVVLTRVRSMTLGYNPKNRTHCDDTPEIGKTNRKAKKIEDSKKESKIFQDYKEEDLHPPMQQARMQQKEQQHDLTEDIRKWMLRAVRGLKRDAFKGSWRESWLKSKMQDTINRIASGNLREMCGAFLKMELEMNWNAFSESFGEHRERILTVIKKSEDTEQILSELMVMLREINAQVLSADCGLHEELARVRDAHAHLSCTPGKLKQESRKSRSKLEQTCLTDPTPIDACPGSIEKANSDIDGCMALEDSDLPSKNFKRRREAAKPVGVTCEIEQSKPSIQHADDADKTDSTLQVAKSPYQNKGESQCRQQQARMQQKEQQHDLTEDIRKWMLRAVRGLKRDAFKGSWRESWLKSKMQDTINRIASGNLREMCGAFLKMELEMNWNAFSESFGEHRERILTVIKKSEDTEQILSELMVMLREINAQVLSADCGLHEELARVRDAHAHLSCTPGKLKQESRKSRSKLEQSCLTDPTPIDACPGSIGKANSDVDRSMALDDGGLPSKNFKRRREAAKPVDNTCDIEQSKPSIQQADCAEKADSTLQSTKSPYKNKGESQFRQQDSEMQINLDNMNIGSGKECCPLQGCPPLAILLINVFLNSRSASELI